MFHLRERVSSWLGSGFTCRGEGLIMACGQALVKLRRFNYLRGFNWALGSVVLARQALINELFLQREIGRLSDCIN